jgi:acetyl-CoA synthetase
LFLPRIPELYISFVGILKTGAIAGTMFAAFGTDGVVERLRKSGAKFLITNQELKKRIDNVRHKLPKLKHIIVVDGLVGRGKKGEIDYQKEMAKASPDYEVKEMNPKDGAVMIFTSSTSYTPVAGIVLPHQAIIQQHATAKYVLDLRPGDTYWCTADPGWVTGVAYGIIGGWSVGASSIINSGRFDANDWYRIIEKYQVDVWYTAPTALRMLKAAKDVCQKYNFSSLRNIASVGEALDPDTLKWATKSFGIPVHENYWQTETGAMIIANYPCLPIRPGSMGKPFPGITAKIVDTSGKILKVGEIGHIVVKPNFPALMKMVWQRKKMFDGYFRHGWYYTGDLGRIDTDGYFWFIGRSDDVIKTSGERVGPFEVESTLADHPQVHEAGVIGKPDKLRGEIIKAFVVLDRGVKPSDKLVEELQQFVKKHLAGHAYPREIEFVDKLPKTRSGKIMRRLLRAKELGLKMGDTSTLEDY